MPRDFEPCIVADLLCCAPANQSPPYVTPRTRCATCGNRVCKHCSITTKAKGLTPGRWCGDCIDSRTSDCFDPFVYRYWVWQVQVSGNTPSGNYGQKLLETWQQTRNRDLGNVSEHFPPQGL